MTPHEAHPNPTRTPIALGSETGRWALLCAGVATVLLLCFSNPKLTANPASRIATIDALVHNQTFVIDGTPFPTIDRVVVHGKNYSSKPPMYSTLGAGVYWVLQHTTDLDLRTDRDDTLYVLTLLIAGVPYLVLLWYAYKLLGWFLPKSPTARDWTFACLALGWLGLAYTTTVNNHVPAGVAAFVAFYYAFGLRRGHLNADRLRYWIYVGLFGGLAPTIDLSTMFLSISTGLYLLSYDWKRTLGVLVPAALLPIAGHFALTYQITGSLLPAYLQRDLYDYPGSYWNHPAGLDALDEPRTKYLFHMLLGHHGLFSMTPVLLFSVAAIVRILRRRDAQYFPEALVIGLPLLVYIVFYTFTTKNYGGVCCGFRWLLPIVPLTLMFVGVSLSKLRSRAMFGLFFVCLLVGQYHTFHALTNPWSQSNWAHWVNSFN